MFADEARFGRMNRPRPCWAPKGVRPEVPCQLIREFTYLYGAVCPKDGTCVFLILPAADTECFQIFLDTLAKKYPRSHILLFVDGAGNHISGDLVIPSNITLSPLPAYSPELNPQENIWDEIREKIFKNSPSNRWMQCTTSLRRRRSTSNVIEKSSNPSLPSPTSSSHHDMEMVSVDYCTRRRAPRSGLSRSDLVVCWTCSVAWR